jgi:capsular polysaccharide biosynthesis protein
MKNAFFSKTSERISRYSKRAVIEFLRLLPFSSEFLGPVKSTQANVRDWMERYQKKYPGCIYQEVIAENYFDLKKAHSLDGNITEVFQEKSSKVQFTSAYLTIIPNGRYYSRIVISPNDQEIRRLTQPQVSSSVIKIPQPKCLTGKTFILTNGCATDDNYYHWIIETISNLYPFLKSGWRLDQIDYFIVESAFRKFHTETLDLLGIPPSKIIDSSTYPHLKADQLIFIDYLPARNFSPQDWAVNFARKIFLPQSETSENVRKKYSELIFISRGNTRERAIVNEREFEERLYSIGFQVVRLETMTVREQVEMFSRAKVIVGTHGAGLTNILFCQPDTIVIELFSPMFVWPLYYQICILNKLEYYYYLAESVNQYLDKDWGINKADHLKIKIDDFILHLSKILSKL